MAVLSGEWQLLLSKRTRRMGQKCLSGCRILFLMPGINLFFDLYGQHPRYVIQKVNLVQNLDQTPDQTPIPAVLKEWANQLVKFYSYLKSEMTYT